MGRITHCPRSNSAPHLHHATGWDRFRCEGVLRVRPSSRHGFIDPVQCRVDASPDTRVTLRRTALSKRGEAEDRPRIAVLADKGAAAVALAGADNGAVRALSLRAEHALMDLISRVRGVLALLIA